MRIRFDRIIGDLYGLILWTIAIALALSLIIGVAEVFVWVAEKTNPFVAVVVLGVSLSIIVHSPDIFSRYVELEGDEESEL